MCVIYIMVCNSEIHDELKILKEPICPLCDQLLIEGNKDAEPCCSKQDMSNQNGINVCINCGLVHGSIYYNEFIDFYANMDKIRRKSVYHRKYHVENVLNDLCIKNRVQLTSDQRNRIYKVFDIIESGAIPVVNKGRKRLISTKFIIKQLFLMMNLPCEFIKISKSKKTLAYYRLYWNEILSLNFGEINRIIQ